MSEIIDPSHLFDTLRPFLARSLHSVTLAQDYDGQTGEMTVPGAVYYHIHVDDSVSRDTVLSALGMPKSLKAQITGYKPDADTKVLYLREDLYMQLATTKPKPAKAHQQAAPVRRDAGFKP